MHFKSLLKEQIVDLKAYKKHTNGIFIFIYLYVHFKLSHSYLKEIKPNYKGVCNNAGAIIANIDTNTDFLLVKAAYVHECRREQ